MQVDSEQVRTGALRPFPAESADIGDTICRRRMSTVLDDVRRAGLTPVASEHADFEDFWEDAYRVSAALRACEAAGLHMRVAAPGETPAPQVRLGPVSVSEEGRHCPDALLYPDALKLHGKRLMARAWVEPAAGEPHPCEFYDVLEWLHFRGAHCAVVKSGNRKSGVSRIPLSRDRNEIRAAVARDEALGWASIPEAAPLSGFLIQEWVPLEYEYRFFVVDGTLITGAGCVEEFTPLNNRCTFDPAMRRLRGNGIAAEDDTEVRLRPDLVESYIRFIEPVASGLPRGQRTVVIDVARHARTGEPLIVEFNSLPNSGLYACDPYILFQAVLDADDRGYAGVPDRQGVCHT